MAIKKRAYHDYRIVVSRQERRPHAELYPFGLPDPIPPFAVPLKPGSAEPVVEIDRLLQTVIDRAGLSVVLDYQSAPPGAIARPTGLVRKGEREGRVSVGDNG